MKKGGKNHMSRFDEKIRQTKWLQPVQSRLGAILANASVRKFDPEGSLESAERGPTDPYAEGLGVQFPEVNEEERITSELVVSARHLNRQGVVHGGVLFTMAEAVLTLSGHRLGVPASTLDVSLSLLAPAHTSDCLSASAETMVVRRRIIVYKVTIVNQHQDLIAVGQATVLRMV